MRYGLFLAFPAMLSLVTASAHADTTAPVVTYTLVNQELTVTSSGPTVFDLSPGQSFSISGSYTSTYTPTGNCNGCYVQTYLAGVPPLSDQVNLFDPASQGDHPGNYFSNGAGTYAATFTAPTDPGTYYLGAGYTEDYHFDPNISGAANGDGQVSYIINVASTPEPSSLVLLATGIAGAAGVVRRRFPSA